MNPTASTVTASLTNSWSIQQSRGCIFFSRSIDLWKRGQSVKVFWCYHHLHLVACFPLSPICILKLVYVWSLRTWKYTFWLLPVSLQQKFNHAASWAKMCDTNEVYFQSAPPPPHCYGNEMASCQLCGWKMTASVWHDDKGCCFDAGSERQTNTAGIEWKLHQMNLAKITKVNSPKLICIFVSPPHIIYRSGSYAAVLKISECEITMKLTAVFCFVIWTRAPCRFPSVEGRGLFWTQRRISNIEGVIDQPPINKRLLTSVVLSVSGASEQVQ